MKTLFTKTFESGRNTKHYEVIEHNGRKFKIYLYIDTSCSCVGFNKDCCLSVMTSDGTFVEVVDNWEIGVVIDKYHPQSAIRTAVKGFKEYLEAIY